ncbi:MAG: Gfo/Idh/MocA family oxidoreductase [Oscillospiraceae bacterium]|nr:Gfo/Idh/MocA family oxidoreductase [Oscillospiraceae bacterium]
MKEKIKVGYIGLGRRGTFILEKCLCDMKDVEITAVCDSYVPHLEKANQIIRGKGLPAPAMTTDYRDILNNPEIDAVFIMACWEGRSALAIESMKAGKYTAIEVGCAFDLGECYDLVDTYEKTGAPLMMLENCCYGRREMMALNIVRQGLFGDVVHCAGGYHHYLPDCELFEGINEEYKHYRINSYIKRNCEQYPTHELGPISKVLNINRGNKMLTLSSFASRGGALKQAAKRILGEDSPYAGMEYKQGDIITTVITCAGGETIHLCLDTTAPRPYYSRNFTVRGTKGMCTEERKVVYFEGMEEEIENNEEEMYAKYDHPLHKEYVALGEKGGHGGMDWLVCRAFIEAVKNGTNTPIDAYDTATWMAIAPLSEASIAKGGAPVEFPDFTRGKWLNRESVVECKYCLDEICVDENTPIY